MVSWHSDIYGQVLFALYSCRPRESVSYKTVIFLPSSVIVSGVTSFQRFTSVSFCLTHLACFSNSSKMVVWSGLESKIFYRTPYPLLSRSNAHLNLSII